MDITDIVMTEFVEVDVDERLAKVRAKFDEQNPRGVIVTDDGAYEGVIGESELVKSRIQDDTKASVLMTSAPRVDHHEDIREVARLLVEGDVQIAPVFRGDSLAGIITGDAILTAVLENLDALIVEQIYSEDVINIAAKSTVGQAINRLREHGISRLPVVDDRGSLDGVITTHDIVDFVVRDHERQHKGDRSGDRDRMLDLPVENLMSSPVVTATPDESVEVAVQRMFDNEISGLVVTAGEGQQAVAGVVTKTDVLRALTFTEEETMDVQITNVELLDTIKREEIVDSITQVVDKYQEMNVMHAHVRFHEHKEKLRGTPLIQAQIRLRTSHGQLAGSGEGYGANHAFHVALDKLERNVLELKGINADKEYRGQLLRKLNEI
ncbi:CBS domain protein [Halohasta litchfieldiae]|jgi:CBS-domain-containing membrane protein|uniref:CBS domain-containing protein n=1 Tax=Halohasta litchfieldiae TaxID=1073996 RepID=A0A1H6V3W7_9EURY|nr:CBS domain-containing protein [Halohasta litchfieldiae]ATW87518.1 CBS domain protein [Halohasta litchfieldiae]SEI99319.1 CBS domain-containing protein [Halohasta litchfieldiae]